MLRILVVEDDFDIQELLQNYLENDTKSSLLQTGKKPCAASPTARQIWSSWI